MWVGERTKAIVILLPYGIPHAQVDGLVVHHHVGRKVIKHTSGDVVTWEGISSLSSLMQSIKCVVEGNEGKCLSETSFSLAPPNSSLRSEESRGSASWWPGELFASDDMDVEVVDGLATFSSAVDDCAEALEAFFLRHLSSNEEKMTQERFVFLLCF